MVSTGNFYLNGVLIYTLLLDPLVYPGADGIFMGTDNRMYRAYNGTNHLMIETSELNALQSQIDALQAISALEMGVTIQSTDTTFPATDPSTQTIHLVHADVSLTVPSGAIVRLPDPQADAVAGDTLTLNSGDALIYRGDDANGDRIFVLDDVDFSGLLSQIQANATSIQTNADDISANTTAVGSAQTLAQAAKDKADGNESAIGSTYALAQTAKDKADANETAVGSAQTLAQAAKDKADEAKEEADGKVDLVSATEQEIDSDIVIGKAQVMLDFTDIHPEGSAPGAGMVFKDHNPEGWHPVNGLIGRRVLVSFENGTSIEGELSKAGVENSDDRFVIIFDSETERDTYFHSNFGIALFPITSYTVLEDERNIKVLGELHADTGNLSETGDNFFKRPAEKVAFNMNTLAQAVADQGNYILAIPAPAGRKIDTCRVETATGGYVSVEQEIAADGLTVTLWSANPFANSLPCIAVLETLTA